MTSRFALAVCVAAAALATASSAFARESRLTDDEVKQRIISESIKAYPGTCACPYSTMRNGHRCGGRSAHSKPGGRAPICYANNVTDAMVARWRQTHGEKS